MIHQCTLTGLDVNEERRSTQEFFTDSSLWQKYQSVKLRALESLLARIIQFFFRADNFFLERGVKEYLKKIQL